MRKLKWSTIVLSVLVTVFLILSPPFLIHGMEKTKQDGASAQDDKRDIIRIWNIDTWEGGKNSRTTWLINRAKEFEKGHKNVYLDVRSYSPEQAKVFLKSNDKNILPDMISFGQAMIENPNMLIPFEYDGNVRQDILKSGQWNGNQYALPWAMGGYGLLLHAATEASYKDILLNLKNYVTSGKSKRAALIAGRGNYYSPLTSIVMTDNAGKLFGAGKDTLDNKTGTVTPPIAWQDFSDNQANILLASQRDIYRAKDEKVFKAPEDGNYTDMIQYLGVIKKDGEAKIEQCREFALYILDDANQAKLSSLGLFSVKPGISLYAGSGKMEELEKGLSHELTVCPAFIPKDKLDELNDDAIQYIKGQFGAIEKINEIKSRFFN